MQPNLDKHVLLLAERRIARTHRAVRADEVREAHARLFKAVVDHKDWLKTCTEVAREVDRWERRGLCDPMYVEAWRRLLNADRETMEREVLADDCRGLALRQNSPLRIRLSETSG